MHVFHTAGVPPRRGSSSLPIIGWTEKSRQALTSSVRAKRKVSRRRRAMTRRIMRDSRNE